MWGVWENFINEQIEVEQKVSFSVKTGYKQKRKRTTYWPFEKLFLKIALKSIHVGGVGKLDQQN